MKTNNKTSFTNELNILLKLKKIARKTTKNSFCNVQILMIIAVALQ